MNSPIVLVGQSVAPYRYSVEIYGDGPATVIRAGAAIDSVISKDSTFNRGYYLRDMTLDANTLATHDLHISGGAEIRVDHVWFINAAPGGSNVKFEAGAGENFISNSFFQNDPSVITNHANIPTYNLDVEASDSHFTNNVFWNALTCNVYDNGSDNHFDHNHGYGFPDAYVSPHNFCINGAGDYTGNTADTATASGFYITGYGAHLTGNHAQGGGSPTAVTVPTGFEIASGVQNVLLVGNWSDETYVTNAVVQDGSPGLNTIVFANGGGVTQPVYSNIGPLVSGAGNSAGSSILGIIGSYNSVNGPGSFGIGSGVNDQYRVGCFFRANGTNTWQGDAQIADCVFRGSETSGTTNILTTGSGTPYQNTEIRIRIDIPAKLRAIIHMSAFCSTGDYADWDIDFDLIANKSAASVKFVDGSGTSTTTTPPTFTTVRMSTGATSGSWTPAVVLDTTNGGAYLTGSGTCTGGKTIYWHADGHFIETASGSN